MHGRRASSNSEARSSPAPSSVDPQVLQEIMESLPSTPETQLTCGLEIMKSAFAQRVAELEEENIEVRTFGKDKMQQVTTLEQKVSSVEKTINELTIRARELGSENNTLMTERDELQEKAAGIAAHVKALQAFKKNCQSFLDCRDDLPDMPITPEPPGAPRALDIESE